MRKALTIGIVLSGGALAVALVGFGRAPAVPAADLATVRVTRETLTHSTVALGIVKPQTGAEVKVGSRLSGVVAELAVGIGDRVGQGDLLALLDDREWQARVVALEAELAETLAKRDLARLALTARSIAAVAPLERASARTELTVLEAAADRSRARLAEAEIQLGYTRIVAPVAGTIASVSTYEGETVAASFAAPTFVTIVDLGRLEVHAYVDETDIGQVHEGMAVTVRVDAYASRNLSGTIRTIRPKAELVSNVVNYVAIVDLAASDTDVLLRPEMTAHVSLPLAERANALTLPRSAVLREAGGSFAIAVAPGGVRKTSVETGLVTPQRIEIVRGLAASDEVVADARRWQQLQTENAR